MSVHDEAIAYSEMRLDAVNEAFVDDLLSRGTSIGGGAVGVWVMDLGCGTCDIPVKLCQRDRAVRVLAIDSSVEMLDLARRQIDFGGMIDRISLAHDDVKTLDMYHDEIADTVISNSLFHHLPEPELGLRTAVRLLKHGGRLFVRDLVRPEDTEQVEELVRRHCEGEPDIAKQLLRQSLHAALTLDEIRHVAANCGVDRDCVQITSDRHWTLDWNRPDNESA
jgi:ubiquinone/menaquinone biosynthesis C-methylase UbiE